MHRNQSVDLKMSDGADKTVDDRLSGKSTTSEVLSPQSNLKPPAVEKESRKKMLKSPKIEIKSPKFDVKSPKFDFLSPRSRSPADPASRSETSMPPHRPFSPPPEIKYRDLNYPLSSPSHKQVRLPPSCDVAGSTTLPPPKTITLTHSTHDRPMSPFGEKKSVTTGYERKGQ
jgi:hypothetical protein